MKAKSSLPDSKKQAQLLAGLRRDVEARQESYRGRALQMFPHICALCGREFSGKGLAELTVHHKDHNHDNNPPDGSNWELLCLYCHDEQHAPGGLKVIPGGRDEVDHSKPSPIANPFGVLDSLLKPDKKV